VFFGFHFVLSLLRPLFLVLFDFVLRLISSVPCQAIGWKEHLQNYLFYMECDVNFISSQSVLVACCVDRDQVLCVGVMTDDPAVRRLMTPTVHD